MNTQPSIYARRLGIGEAAIADLGPGMHPRISIAGGHFTLIDAGGIKHPWPHLQLPVVIIGANPKKSKIYFENGYDPNTMEPPTCYSDNGVAPSMNATRKMARTCAECELNAWGSDTSFRGKASKACADKKKLAVIVLGDPSGTGAYELQIPPATLKNLTTYNAHISGKNTPDNSRKADLSDVVTTITFVQDQVGVLQFNETCWLSCIGPNNQYFQNGAPDGGLEIAQRIDEIIDSGVIEDLVGMNDKPWSGTLQGQIMPPEQPRQLGAPSQVATHPFAGQPTPVTGPFAGPAQAQPAQPQSLPQAQQPKSTRGGARPGAGRPKTVMPAPQEALHQPPAQTLLQPTELPPLQTRPIAPITPMVNGDDIPPFLRRAPAPQAEVQHGMAQAQPAPTGLMEAVNAAFALNTNRG